MRKVSVKWLVFMMTGLMLFVSCSGNNNNKDKAKMGNEEMTVLLMKTTAKFVNGKLRTHGAINLVLKASTS